MLKRKSSAKRFIAVLLTLVMVFNLTLLPMPISAGVLLWDDIIVPEEAITQFSTSTPGAITTSPGSISWDGVTVPEGTTALVSIRRTAIPTAADPGNRINADEEGGIFNAGAFLTGWDYNQSRAIGASGSRTPIVMENGGLNTATDGHNGWKASSVVGIDLA